MAPERRRAVAQIPSVRWVGPYHAAFRIDPELIQSLAAGDLGPRRYNMMVVDKHVDKPALGAQIRALGGVVDDEHQSGLLYTATLTPPPIAVAHLDQVLFIDAWSPVEDDVDNARIQGGANYVESQAGYSGATLNLHIYEGIDFPPTRASPVRLSRSTARRFVWARHQHRRDRLW